MNLREEVKASACLGTGSGELSNPFSSFNSPGTLTHNPSYLKLLYDAMIYRLGSSIFLARTVYKWFLAQQP